MLNPVGDDTACFAGMNFYPDPALDLSEYNKLSFSLRATGDVDVVKVVLQTNYALNGAGRDYEQYLTVRQ